MSKEEKEELIAILSRPTMYGEPICTSDIVLVNEDVFGDNRARKMEFLIFNGLAYCFDYNGKEYKMQYPKLSLIKVAKEMEEKIRTHLDLDKDHEITPVDILMTYNQLSEAY